MVYEFEHSSAKTDKVRQIQFGVMSPDEIKSASVCEITSPMTYENGLPKRGGLLDMRLGTTDRAFNCETCSGDDKTCSGHFGHIELARPVLHVSLIPVILKVLRCVCYHCSALLLSPGNKKIDSILKLQKRGRRLHAIMELCRTQKLCSGGYELDLDEDGKEATVTGCGLPQPAYRREGITIMREFPADAQIEKDVDFKAKMEPQLIHEMFRRISDDDARTLGFNPKYAHPSWFILTILPISPPQVRPSVVFNTGAQSSDDLTYKVSDIVKMNSSLLRAEAQGAPGHVIQDYAMQLQYHVATMFDNELPAQFVKQSCQRSGRPIKSIRQRLVGKAGRIRGNLMGKRVDFSARTVITGE
jgi:DNA-directed RNA polymerase II subunit RPB1